ncbi:hypothetical protein CIC12_21760 [Burkholderia sp. SG-MS1]|uniref:DUF4148 domain-containing protein n=1 Tax=Paraburkholderia sp. SG-MS1 TaxID=2023741 RepID=UPI001444F2F6|nr:DUF4148 domain-containing protein [Paraburkholderia sp. SG-MS1]NKJ49309.1 hypothetical protein [Paraburkholderia sp. SG-MS1]
MKSSIQAVVAAVAVCVCGIAHAQASQPVTRAQVRSEVVALVKHGYKPNRDDYPETLLAAQQRLAEQRDSSSGRDRNVNVTAQ